MTEDRIKDLIKNQNKSRTTVVHARENRQKRFLKAYIACAYNLSEACKKAGVRRQNVIDWKAADPEFANKMWEIEESITDFVETQMLKQIRNNNPAMIMWFLETKGKNRGYTRKFEMENNIKIELSTEQIDAMVRAHELATKDDEGRLTLPTLRIEDGKGRDETGDEDGYGAIEAEYRETGGGDEAKTKSKTEPGDAGSEISGS